jgi:hypothetical protein
MRPGGGAPGAAAREAEPLAERVPAGMLRVGAPEQGAESGGLLRLPLALLDQDVDQQVSRAEHRQHPPLVPRVWYPPKYGNIQSDVLAFEIEADGERRLDAGHGVARPGRGGTIQ